MFPTLQSIVDLLALYPSRWFGVLLAVSALFAFIYIIRGNGRGL